MISPEGIKSRGQRDSSQSPTPPQSAAFQEATAALPYPAWTDISRQTIQATRNTKASIKGTIKAAFLTLTASAAAAASAASAAAAASAALAAASAAAAAACGRREGLSETLRQAADLHV